MYSRSKLSSYHSRCKCWILRFFTNHCSVIFQNKSHEEILSLKEVVKDSGTKVKQLEYRIDELQFKLDSSLSLVGDACDTLDKPSIFLIGGYNGVSWLSSLDAFSPEKDILVPLAPLSSARSYASVATLEGCIFVCGGGVGDSFGNTGMSWYFECALSTSFLLASNCSYLRIFFV